MVNAVRILNGVLSRVWLFVASSHYLLLALLFIVGLELIFALQRWVIAIALVTVAVVVIGIIVIKLEDGPAFGWVHTILPIMAAVGLSGFAFLLPTTLVLHAYIVMSGLLLFLLMRHGARRAYPVWNWALSLVVYFLNVAFALGLNFHLYLPVLVMLFMIAAITAAISYQALTRVAPALQQNAVPTLGISLAITEVTWALQFLPSHYLIQAGVVASLYYVIFNLVSISYMKAPTRRDVWEYLLVGAGALLIILSSAQWK